MAAELLELGADVLLQPAIEIHPPADWSAVDAEIERLDMYDWIVFASANGVRFFLDRL
jgi:uroporphyrinogen III methyltransferase/synthase